MKKSHQSNSSEMIYLAVCFSHSFVFHDDYVTQTQLHTTLSGKKKKGTKAVTGVDFRY